MKKYIFKQIIVYFLLNIIYLKNNSSNFCDLFFIFVQFLHVFVSSYIYFSIMYE